MLKNKHNGYSLDQSPLYRLQSKKKLLSLLYINKRSLKLLCNDEGSLYKERDIISDTGKIRHIEEPVFNLKQVQQRIAYFLKRIKIPEYIHAPKQNYSYITNAKTHIGFVELRNIDIATYFSSTTGKHVYRFFHNKMKCAPDIAGILTRLATFCNHLPTGSPLSPILSFFSHLDMWDNIYELVTKENCKLSVYIDDITISGERVSNKLMWRVKQQLYSNELCSNPAKEKYYKCKKACKVTGIIISDGILKLPNRQYLQIHKVRSQLFRSKDEDISIKLTQKLGGLESQLEQVIKANYSTT